MSEYPPIGPGTGAKRGGLAGCVVPILVGCGLIVALMVSAAIFVGWRLTREGPPAPSMAMRDGGESFYLHARLRADDAGVDAFAAKLLVALRQAQSARHAGGRRNPWMDSQRAL